MQLRQMMTAMSAGKREAGGWRQRRRRVRVPTATSSLGTRRHLRPPAPGCGPRPPDAAPRPASAGPRPWRTCDWDLYDSAALSRRWTTSTRMATPLLPPCQGDGRAVPIATPPQGARPRPPQLCPGDGQRHRALCHRKRHSQDPRHPRHPV